jgi:hypothetical protein
MKIFRTRSLACAGAAALLFACVKHKEEVEVRPDGSISVRVTAEGPTSDVGEGYPVPLDGPWVPADGATRRWLAEVGPDTGGPWTRAGLAAGAWNEDNAKLVSRAVFAGARDVPRFFAGADDPYRAAYLARDTDLRVEWRGGRRVYVFERSYSAPSGGEFDLWKRFFDSLPEPLPKQLEDQAALSEKDWSILIPLVQGAFQETARRYVRRSVGAVYTEGDASLSTAALERVLGRVDARVADLVPGVRLRELYERERLAKPHSEAATAEQEPDFEAELRATLRAALGEALLAESVDEGVRNAIRERLEWSLTASDQAADLGGEEFVLEVRMPGAVIDGNYDRLEGGTARFEFKGEALTQGLRTLFCVSVLE